MNPIYVAMDTASQEKAQELLSKLGESIGGVKIGLEFWCANGPAATKALVGDRDWFLDLKFHDIPNTVIGAIRSVVPLAPNYLTIHSAGGDAMIRAAVRAANEAAEAHGVRRPKILAVTSLTSLPVSINTVVRQGYKARECGVDGLICSPIEVSFLRDELGKDCFLAVPGIRLNQIGDDDQTRIATPKMAIDAGADILVVGRPITMSPDPLAAAEEILHSLT